MSSSKLPVVLGGQLLVDRPKLPWPIVDSTDVRAVGDVVRGGLFANEDGRRLPVDEYEEAFARFQRARFAVAMTNGTHTLQLMLEALGIGLGDVVFVPGLTWQATAATVMNVNALPWLVGIDRGTWAMSPPALEAAIVEAKKTDFVPRAVVVVHLYNRMADLDEMREICARHGLVLLEDCAHAHGAAWRDRGAGTVGVAGSFSFQRSKANTTGEGGIVTTDDPFLAAVLRSARNCGRVEEVLAAAGLAVPTWAEPWIVPGVEPPSVTIQSDNYRMTELQAALGITQLDRFDRVQRGTRGWVMAELDQVAEVTEGIAPQRAQHQVTTYPQYKWAFTWDEAAWDGLPAAAAQVILEAELGLEVCGPYEPLTRSPYYQPHSKPARHKLGLAYWNLLDTRRYDLPEVERAATTGIVIEHRFALDSTAADQFADALEMIRLHRHPLMQWWAERNA
jgi:L-glutamine:2-deoxy-scyllo-inosose/3-amino-2,3-dideoxy-scyllo-inosose aminotransferase